MKKVNRYVLLGLAMLAFLLAGVIYAWSTIKTPFTAEFGWDGAGLQFNYTLTLIFFCLGGLLSGLISSKTSVRLRMALAALCLTGGFVLCSALSDQSIFWLYLGYGFLAGTGIGIAYNTLIAVTGAWFPDRKGLCSGCLMMAFGFSALLVGKLATAGFDGGLGWRWTYRLLGLVTGCVLLAAGLVLRLPKPEEIPQTAKKAAAGAETEDLTPAQMLKRPSFYMLFVFFFLLASVGSTAIGSAREVLSAVGESAAASTATVVGLVSICNGLGRLASGAAFDALGLRRTQFLTSGVAIIAPATVLLALTVASPFLAALGLCLCGFSYGFSPTVTIAFCNTFYGRKHFAVNLPILNLVLIPAAFMTTLGAALPSMSALFLLLTGFSVAGLILNSMIRHS